MSTIEERLASLEARMDAMADLRALITNLDEKMTRGFSELRADVSRRIDTLDEKSDRHFTRLVGIQVAFMVAVVGALVGTYFR